MTDIYRTGERGSPLSTELCTLMKQVETATIGHFEFSGFVGARIHPVSNCWKAVGQAVTVSAPGRDATVIYRALELLEKGDILVVSRVDGDELACVGGGVATAAKARGASAIVVDGPCTDVNELLQIGLPVWCRGVTSQTTSRQYRIGGAINVPIACGKAAVLPGHAVLADENGIFIAERELMRSVCRVAIKRQDLSSRNRAMMAAGHSILELDRRRG